MTQYHRLRVSALIDETHDSKSIVWEVPASLASAFKYQPGQFLTLRLPIDGVFVPRCYSISSSPALDAAPRVTVNPLSIFTPGMFREIFRRPAPKVSQ